MVHGTLYATSKRELKKQTKEYLKNFHPAGYGTHFKEIQEEKHAVIIAELPNGNKVLVDGVIYFAEFTRASSCD